MYGDALRGIVKQTFQGNKQWRKGTEFRTHTEIRTRTPVFYKLSEIDLTPADVEENVLEEGDYVHVSHFRVKYPHVKIEHRRWQHISYNRLRWMFHGGRGGRVYLNTRRWPFISSSRLRRIYHTGSVSLLYTRLHTTADPRNQRGRVRLQFEHHTELRWALEHMLGRCTVSMKKGKNWINEMTQHQEKRQARRRAKALIAQGKAKRQPRKRLDSAGQGQEAAPQTRKRRAGWCLGTPQTGQTRQTRPPIINTH